MFNNLHDNYDRPNAQSIHARGRRYGWHPSGRPSIHPRYAMPAHHAAGNLPASVDLSPECPAVYDQGALGSCHDSMTEVLTRGGWKFFRDVVAGDELATVNPEDGELTFEVPTRMVGFPYSGEMFRGSHDALDFLVTPDHKMVVRKWDEFARTLSSSYSFVDMKDVGWYAGLRNSVVYRGASPLGETVTIPGVDHKRNDQRSDLTVPTASWLRFLGIFVAEGTLPRLTTPYRYVPKSGRSGEVAEDAPARRRVHYKVQIAAFKEREKAFIREVFANLGVKALELKDRFTFENKRIYKALEGLGYSGVRAPDKFVPDFVFEASGPEIREFLLGHFMGDGSIQGGHISHHTSSKSLAEGLQRLIFLSGGWSSIGVRDPRATKMKDGREVVGRHPRYRVSSWGSRNLSLDRKANVTRESYEGMVYCAEVPTHHTLVTRRNGKILISGNCTGNALAGLFQFLLMKLGRPTFVPSRLMIYWGERAAEGTVGLDVGANGDDGIAFLQAKGVCPESTWPYDASRFAEMPPRAAWGEAYHHKLGDPVAIKDGDLAQIRSCLASGYPVAFGFTAYPDLESPHVAATGQLPMPAHGDRPIGGHEVLLVGYDDATQLFKVRNSWGPGWGLRGYFLMPYAYLANPNLAGDFRSARLAG